MPAPSFAQGVTNSSFWFAHAKSMSASTQTAAKTDTAKAGATQTADTGTNSGETFWGDVLDVVNPLQHLPIVSTIYRAVTGDKIGDVEKVAGDTLYGGPIGLVTSLADVAFEKITGKDFGDTVMSAVGLGGSDNNTALASNTAKTKPDKAIAATAPSGQPLIVANAAPIPLFTPPATPADKPKAAATTQTPAPAESKTAAAAKSAMPVDISPDTNALLEALARNGVTGDLQSQALDAYRRTMQMNSAATVPPTS